MMKVDEKDGSVEVKAQQTSQNWLLIIIILHICENLHCIAMCGRPCAQLINSRSKLHNNAEQTVQNFALFITFL
jgi:sulfite exporter TauE/SafE